MGILSKLAKLFARPEAARYELKYPVPENDVPGLETGYVLGEYAIESPIKVTWSWRSVLGRDKLLEILRDFKDWNIVYEKMSHSVPRDKSATLLICAPMAGGVYRRRRVTAENVEKMIRELESRLPHVSPSTRRKYERKIAALRNLLERIRRGEIPKEMTSERYSCIVLHKMYGKRELGIGMTEKTLDELLADYTKENVEVVVVRERESVSDLFSRIFGAIDNLASALGKAKAGTAPRATPAIATAPATPVATPAPATAVATAQAA